MGENDTTNGVEEKKDNISRVLKKSPDSLRSHRGS